MKSLFCIILSLIASSAFAYEVHYSHVIFRNITQVNAGMYAQSKTGNTPDSEIQMTFTVMGDAYANFNSTTSSGRVKFSTDSTALFFIIRSLKENTSIVSEQIARCQDYAETAMNDPDNYAFYIEGIGSNKGYTGKEGNKALTYSESAKVFMASSTMWNSDFPNGGDDHTRVNCGLIKTDKQARKRIRKLKYDPTPGGSMPTPVNPRKP